MISRPTLTISVFLILSALLLVPRFAQLGVRPMMHDESMFAYYAYTFTQAKPNHYTHHEILHGPTMILSVGTAFNWLGHDSAAVARGVIAFYSVLTLIACLGLWPRRYRWWFAPLLFTSPIILYQSRFLREDMVLNAFIMLGMLGFAQALTRRRTNWLWAILGLSMMLGTLAVKENALFIHAAGLTFGAVWLLHRLAFRRPWRALRLPAAPPRLKGSISPDGAGKPEAGDSLRPEAGSYMHPSYEEVVGDDPATGRSGEGGSGADEGGRKRQVPQTIQNSQQRRVGKKPAADKRQAEIAGAGGAGTPSAKSRRIPLYWILGWVWGAVLGVGIVALLYGMTTPPGHGFDPLFNMNKSLQYWVGQHKEHRISGPIHYHLPILATYELPILLAVFGGLMLDAAQRLRRAIVYVLFIGGWIGLWALWWSIVNQGKAGNLIAVLILGLVVTGFIATWIGFKRLSTMVFVLCAAIVWPIVLWIIVALLRPGVPSGLKWVMDFLHITPNFGMLVLGLLIAPLLAYSIVALREHRPLPAWLAWWGACSLFQYSSAGEKVPWLAVYMILPLYLVLPWLWAPLLRRIRRPGRWAFLGFMVAAGVIAARNDLRLIAKGADPNERIVFNHTTPEFDALCKSILEIWEKNPGEIPLEERAVWLVGEPQWPGLWYFRHCRTQRQEGELIRLPQSCDLIIGRDALLKPVLSREDTAEWTSKRMRLREHVWNSWPPAPDWRQWWGKWWRYYWFRESWTEKGGYPEIIALEPIRPRLTRSAKP